jgi:iron complex transport system ATP-binding protein
MNSPAENPPALSLDGVRAGYRARLVLDGLSLTVQPGERVALLGPNGAGKSTLLRVATGLHAVEAGRVRLFGQEVGRLPAARRARLVSVVPQDLETPLAFTVEEMVLMGRTATLGRWAAPGAYDRAAAEEAMAFTDTLDLRQRLFPQLSGGERQRVVVAMALAAQPRLMLLDEPISHLDMNHRLEIVQLIARLNAEKDLAVVMVGHDLNVAAEFFPRLVLLDRGRIVADGPPAVVLRAETLRAVYHCNVHVQHDAAAGCLRVFPRPAAAISGDIRLDGSA